MPCRLLLKSLILLMTVTSPGAGDVYTSTSTILTTALSEGKLLEGLNKFIGFEYDNMNKMSQFLWERSKANHLVSKEDLQWLVEHPNGAYFIVKLFTQHWVPLANTYPVLARMMEPVLSEMPTDRDFEGALSSLIRLQRVYLLSVDHMYGGNYTGHMGPPLQPEDTYLLGQRAFEDGYLSESVQWLELALRLMYTYDAFPATSSVFGGNHAAAPLVTLAQVASLLGRVYFFMKNQTKAQEMYELSSALDPQAYDVKNLKTDLDGNGLEYRHAESEEWEHNMTTLCLRPRHHTVAETTPMHVCRYKRAFGLSYLTFKEEILSLQPYTSLFYDVINDEQIDAIKGYAKGKMMRGKVGQRGLTSDIRTGDLSWIHDADLTTAAAVSQKVKAITGLEVDQRDPDGPSSAEPIQVVNYGLGGHYDAHTDPFGMVPPDNAMLNRSGERIATFLIYLSDVEKGGSTVFLHTGISVPPRKGMVLFWYNFTPALDNELTLHAGCPVVIGQKWIANKWIWTYGNTFRRPCGPHANSTQQHVDNMLASRLLV